MSQGLSELDRRSQIMQVGFRFFGKAETDRPFANSTSLSEAKLQNLIDLARSALRRTAWRRKDTKKAVNEPYDPEAHEYRYDQDTISFGQLREDLARLALNMATVSMMVWLTGWRTTHLRVVGMHLEKSRSSKPSCYNQVRCK